MISRTKARAGAVVLGAAALAGAVPAYAAVSASSPPLGVAVEIVGVGPVIARGAAVTVDVRVTCPSSTYYSHLSTSVSQRVGGGVAGGSAFQQIRCTNVPEVISVRINAQPGGKAFKAGAVAAVDGAFEAYTPRGGVYLQVDGTFTVRK